MAIWVRGQDVERAQAKKKLDEAEKQRAEIASNASAAAAAPSTDAAKNVDSSKWGNIICNILQDIDHHVVDERE